MTKKSTKPPRPEIIERLRNLGIARIPRTDAGCVSLALYVEKGNGTLGSTLEERVRLFCEAQETWIGKKVAHGSLENPRHGIVIDVVPKTKTQVFGFFIGLPSAYKRKAYAPFTVIVQWTDYDKPVTASPDGLVILDRNSA